MEASEGRIFNFSLKEKSLYRKLEIKSEQILASESKAETECVCVCAQEKAKDGDSKPGKNKASDGMQNNFEIHD